MWALLADLGNRDVAAQFDAIDVTGAGEGAVRALHLPAAMGGGVLRERIERFDPAQRSYEYRVFDFATLPLGAYRARLTVVPDGTQARLRYQSTYAALTDGDTAAADALAQGAFGGLVAQLERVLGLRTVMDYHAPDTLNEALALLATGGTTARLLAGGQTLVPLLYRIEDDPHSLIDLRNVASLRAIDLTATHACLGAMG